ncbi:YccF family protein [Salinibacter altiplanensis]|uniref:YccF family protein n=1 Tax=Salinibacter altiplanensis TaxID=1803181 RepID=UPI0018F88C17|nr:YccF family protein [Salinibacter altiplanensis]
MGIPFGPHCFEIGTFTFPPFGRTAARCNELTGDGDLGTSPLGTLGNVLWFLLCGWWLALGHLATAAALIVTIIGIPFGIQHVKIAAFTLAPVGRTVVREEVVQAARGN